MTRPSIAEAVTLTGGRHDGARVAMVNPDDAVLTVLIVPGGATFMRGQIAHDPAAVLEVLESLVSAVKAEVRS